MPVSLLKITVHRHEQVSGFGMRQ